MRGFWSALAAFVLAANASGALAQGAITQSGPVTAFHGTAWFGNGILADAGAPSTPYLSSLGLFNGATCPFGVSSQTSPGSSTTPYSQFTVCQTATTTTLYFAGVNGQSNPNVYFNIGGVSYPFPGGYGNVTGPLSSTTGDFACYASTTGTLLSDCGGSATFLKSANNLSDIASVSTARTNLGLGGAATLNVGTSGGTVAAGNDSRITGALQAANNLSDIASAATARTNLGLGNVATLNIGTGSNTVAAGNDSRFYGPNQNSVSTAYTFVATDLGGQIYHPSSDTTARTWTIPSNASVPYQVVAKIEIVNDCSAGAITLNINTDTLVWFPSGTTGGGRTIAACGMATLTKVGTTRWVLTGTGIS